MFLKRKNIDTQNTSEGKKSIDQKRWQIAVGNSNVGLWDYDEVSGYVFYPKESKEILGYKDHELTNSVMEWNKKYIPKIQNAISLILMHILMALWRLTEMNIVFYVVMAIINEFQIKEKQLKRILLAKPTRIIGIYSDIMYRKQKEEPFERYLELITSQNQRSQVKIKDYIISHTLSLII